MKFLIFQNSSIFESFGGIEYYLDDTASIISECCGDDNLWVLAPKRSDAPPLVQRKYNHTLFPLEKNILLKKIRNRFSINYFKTAIKIINTFKPQILLCGHVSLAPLVFLLSKKFSVPYITICYGIECWGNLWIQDEFALKKSSLLVSISLWTKNILINRGYSPDKIHILHPHLPVSYENITPKVHSINKEPLTLISVSRLDAEEKYKGQDHVLIAISKLKKRGLKLKYIIQGDGSDRKRLENLTKELGLSGEVEFLPSLANRDELVSIYKNADIFILPSRYGRWEGKWHGEGFGIVFLEAAACGLPAIAYNCGGVTDIIRDGENGILVPQDEIDALSLTIENFYNHRDKLISFSKRAYSRVMTCFKRSNSKEEFLNILRHCKVITL